MTRLFLRSLSLHLSWFVDSLRPGRHPGAPVGPRRLLFLLLVFPAFFGLQLFHWACLALDEVLFPGYRRVPVEAPFFIGGLPRSGTTFTHRTLARDDARFTTIRTWEALLAPSILQRKLLHALAAADRVLGRPLGRLAEALLRRAGGANAIHEVDLFTPEEDYLTLLPAGACFILLLAFPFHPVPRALGRFDSAVPRADRVAILRFYRACLRRHLYCEGRGRRLLSKNAAFASWIGPLREVFPDAVFLLCVREPVSALSSQLSSVAPGCRFFGVDPMAAGLPGLFQEFVADGLEAVRRARREDDRVSVAVVDLSELERDPAGALATCLRRLGTEPGPALADALAGAERQARTRRGGHRHAAADFGLRADEIETCLSPVYEAILREREGAGPASGA